VLTYAYRTKDSHQLAEANRAKNVKLRDAFGLSEFYVVWGQSAGGAASVGVVQCGSTVW